MSTDVHVQRTASQPPEMQRCGASSYYTAHHFMVDPSWSLSAHLDRQSQALYLNVHLPFRSGWCLYPGQDTA